MTSPRRFCLSTFPPHPLTGSAVAVLGLLPALAGAEPQMPSPSLQSPLASAAQPSVQAVSSASLTAETFSVAAGARSDEAASPTVVPPRLVTIGVPDTTDVGMLRPMLLATLEMLERAMPHAKFRLRVILSADAPAQLKNIRPDFVFAPVGADEVWRRSGIETYRVATRKSVLALQADKSTGSVIVALKSRTDLNTLSDLQGRKVVAGLPDSVPGWLAALGEVKKAGFDPDAFFGKTEFLSEYYPEIIASLWGGWADAVVLPTCYLEALKSNGLVATEQLKVIHEKTDGTLSCRRSTDLYPDISLVGFNWTSEVLLRDVTVAMLSRRGFADDQWLSYVPHAAVEDLLKDLQTGPYAYLKDNSIKALYARHKIAFQLAGILALTLILYGALLQVLVRRRTRELSQTLAEQRRMEEEAREHRRRLGHLERRNIVNQMSGMIAHEINSPVGAICNFKAILDMLLADQKAADKNVAMALDGIESEAQRIAGIVGRVRAYAKQQKHAHKPCDLVAIAKSAVRALFVSSTVKARVREHYAIDNAPVMGDSLELELLVLNLLRNASEVHPAADVPLEVTLTVSATEDGRFRVTVADNGRALDEAAFAHLTSMMQSVKPKGLGMGLSIVRGIADSHGAEFEFRKGVSGGLEVLLTIDACPRPEAASGPHPDNTTDPATPAKAAETTQQPAAGPAPESTQTLLTSETDTK